MSDIINTPTKAYLGDGVYADVDASGLILTTEDGISVTNRIVFESEVWARLLEYVANIQKAGKSRG